MKNSGQLKVLETVKRFLSNNFEKKRIYSSEDPGRSLDFEFAKGGRLFEGGALSRKALIKYIKKTSKRFQLVPLTKQ